MFHFLSQVPSSSRSMKLHLSKSDMIRQPVPENRLIVLCPASGAESRLDVGEVSRASEPCHAIPLSSRDRACPTERLPKLRITQQGPGPPSKHVIRAGQSTSNWSPLLIVFRMFAHRKSPSSAYLIRCRPITSLLQDQIIMPIIADFQLPASPQDLPVPSDGSAPFYLTIISSTPPETGLSWCPDVRAALPLLDKTFSPADAPSMGYVPVDRPL